MFLRRCSSPGGSARNCFGQDGQITGGYGDPAVNDADVIAAAKFAMKKGAKKERTALHLVSIRTARLQVVAGLNFDLCLEIEMKRKTDRKLVKRFATTVVYRNLKNKYSLSSWLLSDKPPGT